MDMKPVDPTSLQHVSLPPALVQQCQDDPEALVKLSRGQLAIVQDRMVRMVLGNPEATVGQYAAVHERLSKNSRIETVQPAAGGGQQVVINIIRGEGRPAVTIEGQSTKVADDSASG